MKVCYLLSITVFMMFSVLVGDTRAAVSDPTDIWRIVFSENKTQNDPAVRAGLAELRVAMKEIGLTLASDDPNTESNHEITLDLREMDLLEEEDLTETESELVRESAYEIDSGSQSLSIASRSLLGLAYGVFHLADRIRVLREIPDMNETISPALPYRFLSVKAPLESSLSGPEPSDENVRTAQKEFRRRVADAVKYGYNFIYIHGTEEYVPWQDPSYHARSQRYGEFLDGFIEIAHANHLRVLLLGDEFIYLPSLLKRFEATTSVKDDALWDALQTKYRDLLNAHPDLDGIATRIGEIIPRFDFRGLELIHCPETEPDPRIEERYRRFIKKMHEVVAGEFGKLYLHRTWTVNVHEQHSIPDIYARTFTPDVPEENLILTIKLTSGDQWYHYEPFNSTFGVTPHTTVAQGELYSGYQGGGSYIDYPARYFQAALEWAVGRGTKGIFNGAASEALCPQAIFYVFSRLGWNPTASVDTLTEDWAAATFGQSVRKEIAEIFLLGSVAVRDGIYLRQPGLHNWGPIRHIRTNQFVLKGNPVWDKGKGQDAFLKEVYLECKPWIPQTVAELNRGFEVTKRMLSLFHRCKEQIDVPERATELEELLEHGRAAVGLNRDYVEGFLLYFQYREQPTAENRSALAAVLERLEASIDNYCESFNYYQLSGIESYLTLASRAVEDIEAAEQTLREAPSEGDLQEMFEEARSASVRILEENPNATRVASWEGTIDGRDWLEIQGDTFHIDHISSDSISAARLTQHNEIPSGGDSTIVIDPAEVRGTAFLHEQPTRENENTITVYLEDPAPGQAVFRFDLYAVPKQGYEGESP